MAWNTLSTDDVLSEFTPAEQATLNGIQGGASNLQAVLARVVAAARGVIRAGGYSLGADGTVPDQLNSDVVAIARWRWLISFPQLKSMQTAERKQAAEDAQKRLDKIAEGELAVESPDDSSVADTPSPSMNDKTRELTRDEQDGA